MITPRIVEPTALTASREPMKCGFLVTPACTIRTQPSALAETMAASVTGSSGGQSMITYSNWVRSTAISSSNLLDPRSSDGLGGTLPESSTFKPVDS